MIYVFTSIADGWDNLRAPEVVSNSENVRYICFTNVPNLPCVGPWQYRPLPELGHRGRTSRLPKILPHLMLPADAEFSIYHDGNFQLKWLPEEIIQTALISQDWAAHRHPCRTCLYDEASVLLKENIGTANLVEDQIARYRAAEHPDHSGLWANGFLVRRHTNAVKVLCEHWWREFANGCERDQVSFPFAQRNSGVEVNTLLGVIYESPFMNFWWHAAWKERLCNFDYVPQRRRVHADLELLKELTGLRGIDFPVYECEAVSA